MHLRSHLIRMSVISFTAACGRGPSDPLPTLQPRYGKLEIGMIADSAKVATERLGALVRCSASIAVQHDSTGSRYWTVCGSRGAGERTQAHELRILIVVEPTTGLLRAFTITEPTTSAEAARWLAAKTAHFGQPQEARSGFAKWYIDNWTLELDTRGAGRTITVADTAAENVLKAVS